jgi:multidrug transporter EmrE-like cation transporter
MSNSATLTASRSSTLPLWLLLIASETSLQLLLKSAGGSLGDPSASLSWLIAVLSNPTALAAAACYIGTFSSWMLILQRTELSLAFPATAVTYVSVLLGSHWVFGEPVEITRYLGVALIVGGVSLLRD